MEYWKPYVSVAARQRKAAAEAQRLNKKGKALDPVVIDGRTIARTFWGKAWCENLERYSDFATRLPRGRSYARNGSVIDLQIAAGEVTALVSGSSLYRVSIRITAVAADRWSALGRDCAGAIDSLVDLLQGTLSAPIMERVTRAGTGLFPTPAEIDLDCSCPDWADMCKHVAAVLYGVGARLDRQPALLFALRGVDEKELIASAGQGGSLTAAPPSARVLAGGGLAELFGIELTTFTGATDADDGKPAPRRSTATRTPASTAAPKPVPRTRPTASSRVTSTATASANSAADATSRTATRRTRPSVDATPQRTQPRGAPAGARGGAPAPAPPAASTGRTGADIRAAARAAGSAPASTGPTGAEIRAAARAAGTEAGSVTIGGTVPDAKRRGGAAASSRSATRPAAAATKRKRPTSLSKPR